MNFAGRLEVLENAAQHQGENVGYKMIVTEDGETPQEAIARSGLINSSPSRIICIIFVKAGLHGFEAVRAG